MQIPQGKQNRYKQLRKMEEKYNGIFIVTTDKVTISYVNPRDVLIIYHYQIKTQIWLRRTLDKATLKG